MPLPHVWGKAVFIKLEHLLLYLKNERQHVVGLPLL